MTVRGQIDDARVKNAALQEEMNAWARPVAASGAQAGDPGTVTIPTGETENVMSVRGNGESAQTSASADANDRVQIQVSTFDSFNQQTNTVSLDSLGAYAAGSNTFNLYSGNGATCVVIVKTTTDDGEGNVTESYAKADVTAEGEDHQVTLGDTDEVIVAIKGDTNGDGTLNLADAMRIARSLLTEENPNYAELFSALDLAELIIADVNGSDDVNSADAMMIARTLITEENPLYEEIHVNPQHLPW